MQNCTKYVCNDIQKDIKYPVLVIILNREQVSLSELYFFSCVPNEYKNISLRKNSQHNDKYTILLQIIVLIITAKKVFIYVFRIKFVKSSCEKLRIDYFDYSCGPNIGEKTLSSFLVSIHLLVPILFPLVLISAYLYDICVHYLAACTHDPGFQSA